MTCSIPLQCDLETCMQSRTTQYVDSTNERNLSLAQPSVNRICPIADCLEWRVAHWHGVSRHSQTGLFVKLVF